MKSRKFLVSLLISLLLISISTIGFCESVNVGDYKGDTSGATATKIQNQTNSIIGIVQIVAVGIAVIMLIYLAIKYISAAPSEKADIKKSAIIYIVGAVLLFATTGILGIIKGFATGLTNETSTEAEASIKSIQQG